MKQKRTLYECSHARVKSQRIRCNKGYPLSSQPGDGGLDVRNLAEGKALAPRVCQHCTDFDCLGPPVPEGERGWLNMKEVLIHGATHREALPSAVA